MSLRQLLRLAAAEYVRFVCHFLEYRISQVIKYFFSFHACSSSSCRQVDGQGSPDCEAAFPERCDREGEMRGKGSGGLTVKFMRGTGSSALPSHVGTLAYFEGSSGKAGTLASPLEWELG